ncbi:hypothetical protein Tco_0416722, partial [Tanacetum coccineum]
RKRQDHNRSGVFVLDADIASRDGSGKRSMTARDIVPCEEEEGGSVF